MCKYTEIVSDSDSDSDSIDSSGYNKDALKIQEEYSDEALQSYCKIFEEYPGTVEYNEFKSIYFGYFGTHEEFVDYILEEIIDIKSLHYVVVDYKESWSIIMKYFIEEDNHYFYKSLNTLYLSISVSEKI